VRYDIYIYIYIYVIMRQRANVQYSQWIRNYWLAAAVQACVLVCVWFGLLLFWYGPCKNDFKNSHSTRQDIG
jgi:hypothetical protein